MADLGYCYEKGCGVEQSWEQAFSWYRISAECGNPVSMSNLGLCYQMGYGVEQNWQEAVNGMSRAHSVAICNPCIIWHAATSAAKAWNKI